MRKESYTTKDKEYGYPVTYNSKDKVIDDMLITDLPDVEIAFIVDLVCRLGCSPRELSSQRCGTSYGLKHIVQRGAGMYMSNNQFKSLMVLLQCEPHKEEDYQELNWDCYFIKKLVRKADQPGKRFEIIYGTYRRYFHKYRHNMEKMTDIERKERWQKFQHINRHGLIYKSKAYIKKLNENIIEYGAEKAIENMPSLTDIEITKNTETECELTAFNMLFYAVFGKDTLYWRYE